MIKPVEERLKKVLTYNDNLCINAIKAELGTNTEAIINFSLLAKKHNLTRSLFVYLTRILEVSGVVESRSLGAKGTFIKVTDMELFEKI